MTKQKFITLTFAILVLLTVVLASVNLTVKAGPPSCPISCHLVPVPQPTEVKTAAN